MTHPSTAVPRTPITVDADVNVNVRISYPLLRDVTRRWPGMTLDEKIGNALMLAIGVHDYELAEDAETGDRS
jgi:hypothetical protein